MQCQMITSVQSVGLLNSYYNRGQFLHYCQNDIVKLQGLFQQQICGAPGSAFMYIQCTHTGLCSGVSVGDNWWFFTDYHHLPVQQQVSVVDCVWMIIVGFPWLSPSPMNVDLYIGISHQWQQPSACVQNDGIETFESHLHDWDIFFRQ